VVDDDRFCLELVRDLLEGEDFEVLTTDNVHAGYSFIQEWQPDLVIMDLMQGRQPVGLDVLAAVREDPRLCDVPMIIVSADALRLARLAAHYCQQAEIATLGKPFDLQELIELVQEMLSDDSPCEAVGT